MKKEIFVSYLGVILMSAGLLLSKNVLAQDWTGTPISIGMTDAGNVYLYNESAHAWLYIGSKWGTEASINRDYGIPVVTVKEGNTGEFMLETGLESPEGSGQGRYLGYVGYHEDDKAIDNGLFCDRGSELNGSEAGINSFVFTSVGTDNEYYISFVYGDNTYYITAPSENGAPCELTGSTTDYSKWKVVTIASIEEKLRTSPSSWGQPTNITYAIADANFVRNSNRENQWTSTLEALAANKGIQLGGQYFYKTNIGNSTYNNNKTGENPDESLNNATKYQRNRGKYFGVQVNGAKGAVSQTVKVYNSGWYRVSCQGFFWNENKTTNDVASLFVSDGTIIRKTPLALGNVEGAVPNGWDAAQDEFFGGGSRFKNYVMIKVMMDGNVPYDANGKEITVGIDLAEETASVDDWTAFDDFQVEFLGYNTELILKEDNFDYGYLLNTQEEYINSTLWLNRTFSVGKWNTLVLPVALNIGQFTTAFGANARAAELVEVKDGVLRFVTIKKTGKSGTDTFLDANKPYIVYITEGPNRTEEEMVTLTGLDNQPVVVEIGGADCPYYAIPYVTLNKKDIESETGEISGAYSVSDGTASLTFNGTLLRTYDEEFNIRTGFSDMEYNIILKNGQFWWLTEAYGMKAYRAWIETGDYIPSVDSGSMDSKINYEIDGVENDATEIRDITAGGDSTVGKFANGIYTINGMNMNSASVDNLPKGIYIVNGKKYIVK